MDSNASGFLLNPSTLHSVYHRSREDDGIIDPGLSLRTLQPEAYNPSGHWNHFLEEDNDMIKVSTKIEKIMPMQNYEGTLKKSAEEKNVNRKLSWKERKVASLEGYGELRDWPQAQLPLKHSNSSYQRTTSQECDEEEGVQSKEKKAYVKVNMDGIIVGRKICILDHGGYSSLALQLEDMFGRQSASGLKLFEAGSEFCLLHMDREENWRTVGDVPWTEFVESVKRLRITRTSELVLRYSLAFS